MKNDDIRWKQRFQNYLKAFLLFEEAVKLSQSRSLNKLEEQGLIQRFEFTHELAWNVLKDYCEYQGIFNITGSRDAIRESFSIGLIEDGEIWMDMIKSRNNSSHTYNEEISNELVQKITKSYYPLFINLRDKFINVYE